MDPNDRLTMTLSAFWQRDPRGGNFDTAPLEGTILPNPNGKISDHFYPGDPNFETYKRTQTAVNYRLSYQIAPNWTFKSFARYANVGRFSSRCPRAGCSMMTTARWSAPHTGQRNISTRLRWKSRSLAISAPGRSDTT
ncbi:hypothetical protein RAA17_16445 [Komagataeibacter rhaeticus]|nr:hypothetical protein [Komagataeibacter rhaeticus]